MTSSREDILRRIELASSGMSAISPERHYDISSPLSHEELLDLFEARILDYKATFTRTNDVPTAIAKILREKNLTNALSAPGLPAHWSVGKVDDNFSSEKIDEFDVIITSSELAIAITGTVVLNHAKAGQGRRAISLIPDTHICIVAQDAVLATVVEAVRSLNPREHQTWISGPSATSDIELERVEGVHGPRNLHVILALKS